MKKKYLFFIKFIFILFIILIISSSFCYAAYPKLVAKLINGFEQIKTWIIKIATPAAAVAVRQWCFYEKI